MGEYIIKVRSTTQGVIALSSGKVEYDGLVKPASHSLGIQAIARGMGIELSINMCTDSSAAKGIAS